MDVLGPAEEPVHGDPAALVVPDTAGAVAEHWSVRLAIRPASVRAERLWKGVKGKALTPPVTGPVTRSEGENGIF